jgi:hypothetical protein
MKKILPIALLSLLVLVACGQAPERLNNDGNEAFVDQDFETALAAYQQAQADLPELAEPHYNAANAHYRQEAYEQAQGEIEQALLKKENQDGLNQNSLFNLGNTFFQTEQFETAIEAYKEALRLNPDDVDAKHNLELAMRQLQQQQQEQEQQQEQQQEQENNQEQQDQQQQEQENNQEQQDQQQQEQENNQEQQDQQQQEQENNQEQQDQQQQEQENNQDQQEEQEQQEDGQQDDQQQDEQQQDGQQDDQQQDEQQQDGQPTGQPQMVEGLTEEQARQLFEAASQGTESLEEFLQQIYVFPGRPPAEDW